MIDDYPPRSDRLVEIEQMGRLFGTVVEGRAAVYLSAPITSGRNYMLWRQRCQVDESTPEYSRLMREGVISPNRDRARRAASRLRSEMQATVIDPTALPDCKGWTQADYRILWGRVIEHYASKVVFLDDWEFSSGCVFEFRVANEVGVSCFDEQLRPLDLATGLSLVREAILEREQAMIPVTFLSAVERDLQRLLLSRECRHANP